MHRLLVVASTFPASERDSSSGFVRDQVTWFKKIVPDLDIHVLAPHNAYTATKNRTKHRFYTEHRFHYFWPRRWELLAGRAIAPTLKQNPLLYFTVPFFVAAEVLAIIQLTRRVKPDLIYAHWFMPQAVAAALACLVTKIPFVFTTHSGDAIVLKKIPFGRTVVKWVCRRAKAFSAVSEQTSSKLLSMVPNDAKLKKKLAIIPMGTTIPRDSIPAKKTAGPVQLLFIGRLVPIKGIHLLLEALARLQNAYKFELVITGDGSERAALEQQVEQLDLGGSVSFTGFVQGEQKNSLFKNADIVCIPSLREGENTEGLPVVFMEALAHKKIVVASNVTGAQEYITDGVDGFLFEQGNVDALIATLETVFKLTKSQKEAAGQHAFKLSEQFDWPVITKRHIRHFFKEHSAQ